jgi:hypothetical protein
MLTQGTQAVAVGGGAGQSNQGNYAVSIGNLAGRTSQGTNSVAIGKNAGMTSQGSNSVAVGVLAGSTSQGAGTIILNASGVDLSTTSINGLFVKPIRGATNPAGGAANFLWYDATSGEICYHI